MWIAELAIQFSGRHTTISTWQTSVHLAEKVEFHRTENQIILHFIVKQNFHFSSFRIQMKKNTMSSGLSQSGFFFFSDTRLRSPRLATALAFTWITVGMAHGLASVQGNQDLGNSMF